MQNVQGMRDDVNWVAMAPEVACRLIGEPDLKTKREWRWGEGGIVRLDLAKGAFTDFETGVSGGAVAMVMYVLRMDRAAALEWLWSEGLLREGRSQSRRPEHTPRPEPVAEILKHPMGSIRDMLFADDTLAALQRYADTDDDPIPESYQMNLPGLEPESVIRPANGLLPLDCAGVQTKIRKGHVSHAVRIFLEVIMALEEGQDRATIRCTLGNLADYLYPDGKFKKHTQLEHIHKGLHDLHVNAYVPFMDPTSGQLRSWRPVTVTTSLAPSDDEDSIFFDVILPPDARQGPRVLKEAVRATGRRSAPQFNAYLAAADVIDRYGEQNGEIIDPARPESRNEQGHLIDGEDGATHAEEDGTPAARPYRPDAAPAMNRGRNPKADRYPVVSFSDLIRACWPGVDVRALTPATKREKVTHAKKHWKALEQDGHIRIEALAEGWRILPSEKHVRTYRALMHQKRHPPRVEPAS